MNFFLSCTSMQHGHQTNKFCCNFNWYPKSPLCSLPEQCGLYLQTIKWYIRAQPCQQFTHYAFFWSCPQLLLKLLQPVTIHCLTKISKWQLKRGIPSSSSFAMGERFQEKTSALTKITWHMVAQCGKSSNWSNWQEMWLLPLLDLISTGGAIANLQLIAMAWLGWLTGERWT